MIQIVRTNVPASRWRIEEIEKRVDSDFLRVRLGPGWCDASSLAAGQSAELDIIGRGGGAACVVVSVHESWVLLAGVPDLAWPGFLYLYRPAQEFWSSRAPAPRKMENGGVSSAAPTVRRSVRLPRRRRRSRT